MAILEINVPFRFTKIEKLRIQKDADDRFEQQMTRYEDRITELHSVIAELRKKIDQRQINVIRSVKNLIVIVIFAS